MAGQSTGWCIPKFHCMAHRAVLPFQLGCSEVASTNSGEHAHIEKIKKPARLMNRKGDWQTQLLDHQTKQAATHALSKETHCISTLCATLSLNNVCKGFFNLVSLCKVLQTFETLSKAFQ